MLRIIVSLSLFVCLAHSATTELKTPLATKDVKTPLATADVKAPLATADVKTPLATLDKALWTDISLKEPSPLIGVDYKSNGKVTNVRPGAVLEKIVTGPAPKLTWQLEKNIKYTVAMIDLDAPSRKEPSKRSVSVRTNLH